MFERFMAFLRDMPGAESGEQREDDPRVAAAALLFHVMDADGIRQDVERERIKSLLGQTYGLNGAELEVLLRAGQKADSEAIDLYAFTSVLKRHLDDQARYDFIKLMWAVCYADGEIHELEDNTLWRVAELLSVESRDRVLARQEILQEMGLGTPNRS